MYNEEKGGTTMKIKGLAGKTKRQQRFIYLSKQIETKYPQLTSERPRSTLKREALLMIEQKTGKKKGTI